MIYREMGKVIFNEEIAEGIYKTVFISPNISSSSIPGQFVNILPSLHWDNVMRRPMSIASQGNDEISIIYKSVGEGTHIMANWAIGEKVDLIGPLGNYWDGYESSFPIIIGGGVGIAPILNLHNVLLEKQIDHCLIMGARHSGEHFLPHEPQNKVFLSTDDGSLGIKGNVVDILKSIYPIGKHPQNTKIFSCGPPMMIEGVRNYSHENKLDCDLALETIMACGFGICQGCTVERKAETNGVHSYRNRFALACLDGPIFNAEEIISCV